MAGQSMDRKSWSSKVLPYLLVAAVGAAAASMTARAFRSRHPADLAVQASPEEAAEAPAEDAEGAAAAPTEQPADSASDGVPSVAADSASPATPSAAAETRPAPPALLAPLPPGPPLLFREIWTYIYPGEERRLSAELPITDICLFDFSLDETGRLYGKANTEGLKKAKALGIRTHLAIASSGNKSLFHLALTSLYGVRMRLIAGIAHLPRQHAVDGIQIDFEGLHPREGPALVGFMGELKKALPRGTILSMALPAKKTDEAKSSAFVYADLAGLADRFFIMVYDLHWKGGPPGAISDVAWHDQVLACALSTLPQDRTIVGLPFYGRVWQREDVAHALTHPQAQELAAGKAAVVQLDPRLSHTFTWRTEVTAECWFEDAASVRAKLESTRAKGFRNVGFWRLGQEDPRIWGVIGKEAGKAQ